MPRRRAEELSAAHRRAGFTTPVRPQRTARTKVRAAAETTNAARGRMRELPLARRQRKRARARVTSYARDMHVRNDAIAATTCNHRES